MKAALAKLLCGLSPAQATAVVVTFFATLIGAIALAWVFRRWNARA